MKIHPPLTADDLTWLPDDDDDVDVDDKTDAPNGAPEVEQPPSSAKDAEEATIIKRKANAKIRQIESVTSNRNDKSLSEIELAEDWLETQESDRYLYADGLGWRRYLHGRWHDGGHEINKDISAFIRDRVEATASARTLNKHSVVRSAMAYVAEHRAVPADSFDADPLVVAFPDGTLLDVRTWTRRPAEREDRLCKTLAAAPAEEPSSLWADFVFEALDHYQESRRLEISNYLQEWLGVALTGDCRDETFLFLWGTRGAGKGTLSETICTLMGAYGSTLAGERVAGERHEHRQWMAGLQGKRFTLINELPERGRWRSDDLNKMVSGEVIEANRMRQDSFEFRSMSHLLIVGNTQPTANAASGIWRRLAQVEFRHAPEHPDKLLKEKLLADLPGIAQLCLTGLQRWAERGHLPPAPREIQEAVARYESDADPVAAFIAEHTTPSPGNRIEVNELYAAYVAHFKVENGNDAEIYPKQRTFAMRITDLWGAPEKSNGKTYRAGRMLDQIEDKEENLHLLHSV